MLSIQRKDIFYAYSPVKHSRSALDKVEFSPKVKILLSLEIVPFRFLTYSK